jgi:hypothetical protein
MQQSPSWEANRSSATQEIPRVLLNPKVHHLIHKSPLLVPVLTQIDPVLAPQTSSWRSILILSSYLRLDLPSGLLHSGFPINILYTPFLSPIRATCPLHLCSCSWRMHLVKYMYWLYRSLNFTHLWFLFGCSSTKADQFLEQSRLWNSGLQVRLM